MLAIENVHDLEIARAASDGGSFSAAARELGITQPAVSQAIARLERQVGATLFDRQESGHAAFLTDAGAVLLAHAITALDELQAAMDDLTLLEGERALRVGMPAAIARRYFPQGFGVFDAVRQGHPLEMVLHDSGHLADDLRLKRLDVGMIASAEEGVTLPHVSFSKVASFMLTLAVREKDRPQKGSVSLRELVRRGAPLIGFSGDRFLRAALQRELDKEGLQLNVVAETDQLDMLYQLVGMGMGVGLSSELVFDDAPAGIALLGAMGTRLPTLQVFVFEDTARAKGPEREALGAIRKLLFSAVRQREGR